MKRVQADSLESISNYAIVDADMPQGQPEHLIIEVAACGMGFVDALVSLGGYQVKPTLPFTPGQEIAGRIVDVGPGITTFELGDRVLATTFGGGLSEYASVDVRMASKIPDRMTYIQAAGFKVNYLTAYHALRDRAAIKPGERLIVFGAAGGVGGAAVQLGRHFGAQVVAVASSEAKRAFARTLGAHAVIDADCKDWRERLKHLIDGHAPNVVFDPVTGPLFEPAFRSLGWGGRYLVVGFLGSEIPKLPINLPLMKGAACIGVDVRQFMMFEQEKAAAHLLSLLGLVENGELTVPEGRVFPFEEFANAMSFAMSGLPMAKSVIEVGRGGEV